MPYFSNSYVLIVGAAAAVVLAIAVALAWARRRRGQLRVDAEPTLAALPGAATALASSQAAPRPPAAAAPVAQAPGPSSVFERLVQGLSRTKDRMVHRVDDLFRGRRVVDEQLWRDLEELLVTSDVGIRASSRLLERMRERASREELQDPQRLRQILRDCVAGALSARPEVLAAPGSAHKPLVVMVVGVNGAGKTTTIGKLAARWTREGSKVIIGAGDTFRAAAIEQVVVWGKRAGAEVIKHGENADPAAVAHDAVSAALARGADAVICDTAGRLHTKTDLMAELQKVVRVIGRVIPGAPHEVLLVLDSTNGQNAIAQAREFTAAVGVTGIALTKLDGTARGGVIVGIAEELQLPVKLIGIGESVDDLRDFDADAFVRALFDSDGGLGRGSNSAAAAAQDAAAGITADPEPGPAPAASARD
jgi:fused signal recognition particle receptor